MLLCLHLYVCACVCTACIQNKVIEEICEKSTWHGRFSRVTAFFRVIFSGQQNNCFLISSRGRCVLNFRSLSFFVWPGRPLQANSQTCTIRNYTPPSSSRFRQVFCLFELKFGCLNLTWTFKAKFHRALENNWRFFEQMPKFCD